jgi:hypothetical protein
MSMARANKLLAQNHKALRRSVAYLISAIDTMIAAGARVNGIPILEQLGCGHPSNWDTPASHAASIY